MPLKSASVMREPTPDHVLYAWHRDTMAGLNPPVHDGIPECGWFKTRIVKGGPWVPVEIMVRRDIDPETGELTGPEELVACYDDRTIRAASVWVKMTPISQDEFYALLQRHIDMPIMQATHARLDLTKEPIRP